MSHRFLESAAGYIVYASDGGRIGTVIELVPGTEEHSALLTIRCEGVFLSKRRTVPVTAIAGVNPQERNVTLLLDAGNIERAHELQMGETRQGWVAERIAHYADLPGREDETSEPDADAVDSGRPPVSATSADSPSASDRAEGALNQHLLFAPTAAGYVLIEQDGAAPARAMKVDLPDPPGRFAVVKLAQSPLPRDGRLCAYLDRLE